MESQWAFLDSVIMDNIFEYLSFHDRFNASLVCITYIIKRMKKIPKV